MLSKQFTRAKTETLSPAGEEKGIRLKQSDQQILDSVLDTVTYHHGSGSSTPLEKVLSVPYAHRLLQKDFQKSTSLFIQGWLANDFILKPSETPRSKEEAVGDLTPMKVNGQAIFTNSKATVEDTVNTLEDHLKLERGKGADFLGALDQSLQGFVGSVLTHSAGLGSERITFKESRASEDRISLKLRTCNMFCSYDSKTKKNIQFVHVISHSFDIEDTTNTRNATENRADLKGKWVVDTEVLYLWLPETKVFKLLLVRTCDDLIYTLLKTGLNLKSLSDLKCSDNFIAYPIDRDRLMNSHNQTIQNLATCPKKTKDTQASLYAERMYYTFNGRDLSQYNEKGFEQELIEMGFARAFMSNSYKDHSLILQDLLKEAGLNVRNASCVKSYFTGKGKTYLKIHIPQLSVVDSKNNTIGRINRVTDVLFKIGFDDAYMPKLDDSSYFLVAINTSSDIICDLVLSDTPILEDQLEEYIRNGEYPLTQRAEKIEVSQPVVRKPEKNSVEDRMRKTEKYLGEVASLESVRTLDDEIAEAAETTKPADVSHVEDEPSVSSLQPEIVLPPEEELFLATSAKDVNKGNAQPSDLYADLFSNQKKLSRFAFDDTYRIDDPDHTVTDAERFNVFFHLPNHDSKLRNIAHYIFLGGWLVALKNIFKFVFQYPLSMLDTLIESKWDDFFGEGETFSDYPLQYIGLGVAKVVVKPLHHLVKCYFSPVDAFNDAWKVHPALGVASLLVSLTMYVLTGSVFNLIPLVSSTVGAWVSSWAPAATMSSIVDSLGMFFGLVSAAAMSAMLLFKGAEPLVEQRQQQKENRKEQAIYENAGTDAVFRNLGVVMPTQEVESNPGKVAKAASNYADTLVRPNHFASGSIPTGAPEEEEVDDIESDNDVPRDLSLSMSYNSSGSDN